MKGNKEENENFEKDYVDKLHQQSYNSRQIKEKVHNF